MKKPKKPSKIKVGTFVKSKDNVKYEAFMERGECFLVKEINKEFNTILITSKDGESTHIKIGYFTDAKKAVEVNKQIRNIRGGIAKPQRLELYEIGDIRCLNLTIGAKAFVTSVSHSAQDHYAAIVLFETPEMEPIKVPSKCLRSRQSRSLTDKENNLYDQLYSKYSRATGA